MAKRMLDDTLRAFREHALIPSSAPVVLLSYGQEGYCRVFEADGRREAFYLTFAPPRQRRATYRWVCGPHDLIAVDLEALFRERAIRFDLEACVRALGSSGAEVSRIADMQYWFKVAMPDGRELRLVYRPCGAKRYTFAVDGEEVVSCDTLAEVMASPGFAPAVLAAGGAGVRADKPPVFNGTNGVVEFLPLTGAALDHDFKDIDFGDLDFL